MLLLYDLCFELLGFPPEGSLVLHEQLFPEQDSSLNRFRLSTLSNGKVLKPQHLLMMSFWNSGRGHAFLPLAEQDPEDKKAANQKNRKQNIGKLEPSRSDD